METQKVVFVNRALNTRLAGLLRLPDRFDLSRNYPAVVVTGPYCVITGENAWSKPSSEDVFAAVPHDNKEMHVIPEASHFDMYDLAPFVSEAFDYILPFFERNL